MFITLASLRKWKSISQTVLLIGGWWYPTPKLTNNLLRTYENLHSERKTILVKRLARTFSTDRQTDRDHVTLIWWTCKTFFFKVINHFQRFFQWIKKLPYLCICTTLVVHPINGCLQHIEGNRKTTSAIYNLEVICTYKMQSRTSLSVFPYEA